MLLNKSSCAERGSADTCQSWANASAQKAGGPDFSCIKLERSGMHAFPLKGCTSISKYLYFISQRRGLLWLLMKNVQESSINLHKPRIYLTFYWNFGLIPRRMKSRRRHTNLGEGSRRYGSLSCDVTEGSFGEVSVAAGHVWKGTNDSEKPNKGEIGGKSIWHDLRTFLILF